MKITKIERQKNNEQRYSIFIDGVYSFPLSDLELSNSGLREGQELSESEVDELKRQSLGSKAYDRALNYLSFRPRSSREVRDYLAKKEFDPATVDATIERLEKNQLISDSDFAASWVENRQLLKPKSKRQLQQELRKKGLAEADIEEALGAVDEREAIKAVATKKLAHYKDQRLVKYLLSQGFGYDLIKDVLDELGIASDKQSVR